jgi:molybdate transport system regulatory protein
VPDVKQSRSLYRIRPRIRVLRREDIVIGPGKADLLEAIGRTSKLRDAAKELGMSYMRAWSLVRTMNRSFRHPLVKAERGGAHHGRALLTPTGRAVLALYREMESSSLEAVKSAWGRLRRLLAK